MTRRKREGWHRPHITSSDAVLRRPRPRGEGEPSEENVFLPEVVPPDEDRLPVVPYVPVRCSGCGKSRRETYGRKGRKRYHRCADCGTNFVSVEYPPSQVLR